MREKKDADEEGARGKTGRVDLWCVLLRGEERCEEGPPKKLMAGCRMLL